MFLIWSGLHQLDLGQRNFPAVTYFLWLLNCSLVHRALSQAAKTEDCKASLIPPARRRVSLARSSGSASSRDEWGRRVRSWDLITSTRAGGGTWTHVDVESPARPGADHNTCKCRQHKNPHQCCPDEARWRTTGSGTQYTHAGVATEPLRPPQDSMPHYASHNCDEGGPTSGEMWRGHGEIGRCQPPCSQAEWP